MSLLIVGVVLVYSVLRPRTYMYHIPDTAQPSNSSNVTGPFPLLWVGSGPPVIGQCECSLIIRDSQTGDCPQTSDCGDVDGEMTFALCLHIINPRAQHGGLL